MSADLSQRVRSVLQRVLIELTQGKSVSRSAQQSAMQELRIWCEEHGLETQPWCGVKTVSFDRPVLARIEQTLQELGLHRLDDDIRQQDRFAQSDSSQVEHKSVGLTPKERRVLMAQANCGAYFPEWVSAAPSQWVMDIDWQTLELSVFPSLVVVENLDSFYQYFSHHPQRYSLPELAQQALVIYRGDGIESRARGALVKAFAATGKPVIYFGDYDTAGLSIALHGDYSHIMLPSYESVLRNANDLNQPAEQLHLCAGVSAYAAQLVAAAPVKRYMLHNTEQQKGLRQQGFKGQLHLLPLT